MRYTYRYKTNQDYWSERWMNLPVDSEMSNELIYPLKNAISTIKDDKDGKILEAGCGNGRVLRFFHNKGYNIHGIDFIQNAINKIKKADVNLLVSCQSILNTDFKEDEFKYILAFGLYHNFRKDLTPALNETSRILRKEGVLLASFRADNLQNLILDEVTKKRQYLKDNKGEKHFHKANFTLKDLNLLFSKSNFKIISINREFNMPFLFKFKIFRHTNQKNFNEKSGRNEGYKLNFFGNLIFKVLKFLFPTQFCSLYIVTAKLKE